MLGETHTHTADDIKRPYCKNIESEIMFILIPTRNFERVCVFTITRTCQSQITTSYTLCKGFTLGS